MKDTIRSRSGIMERLAVLLLISLLLLVAADGGCGQGEAYTPPTATMAIEDAPQEMDALLLLEEWTTDPDVAAAKYSGIKLHFKGVEVEQMSAPQESAGVAPFLQMGLIRFQLAELDDINRVEVGYTVEAIGKVVGMQEGKLIVIECWVRVTDPPSGRPGGY